MKKMLLFLSLFPFASQAQKFYIREIDKPLYNSLKNRISYLGFSVTGSAKEADLITELVYEKKKGYLSFKGGYNKVGYVRFVNATGTIVAKTQEQGGIARGYNNYSALSSLFKKIMKDDFDSAITVAAKTYKFPMRNDNPSIDSKADEISKLKKLFDDGVLTKEEFETEKKKVLNNKQ